MNANLIDSKTIRVAVRLLAGTFLATVLMSSHSADRPSGENSEAWPVTSAWVKELPANQQAIAITLALAALNRKFTSLIELRQDREQVGWVAKMGACGYSMLSKVATKNPEFESYLRRHSAAYVQLVRGELKESGFAETEKALRNEGQVLMRTLDENAYRAVKVQYKDRMAATELSLVVYAMLCAK